MVVSGAVESKVRGPRSEVEPGGERSLNQLAPLPPAINHQPSTLGSLDELSTLGENTIAEFYQERGFAVSTLSLDRFPLQPATLDDLRGGDRQANAQIVRRLLAGEERGPKRDAVLLNAAAALFVAGKATSLSAGWELAAELIERGQAGAKLEELVASSR
ncbi:MAG: hypothetical protein HYY24_25375 [Verrucomicrobia bacterium]|nr:hypothetical protein [Verrucomicrobiota bacterium]